MSHRFDIMKPLYIFLSRKNKSVLFLEPEATNATSFTFQENLLAILELSQIS